MAICLQSDSIGRDNTHTRNYDCIQNRSPYLFRGSTSSIPQRDLRTLSESRGNRSFTDKINGVADAFEALHVVVADFNLETIFGFEDDIHKTGAVDLEIVDEQARFRDDAGIGDTNMRPNQLKECFVDLITIHWEL